MGGDLNKLMVMAVARPSTPYSVQLDSAGDSSVAPSCIENATEPLQRFATDNGSNRS